jgi:hypothetical protein
LSSFWNLQYIFSNVGEPKFVNSLRIKALFQV